MIHALIHRILLSRMTALEKRTFLPSCIRECTVSVECHSLNSHQDLIKFTSDSRIPLPLLIHEVIEENSYFPKGIPDFLLEENSVLIDIGANIGIFSVFASINTNSKIIAIEPHPDNYSLLLCNLELNDINNIITINSAVGERHENRFLEIGQALSGCQLIPSGHSVPTMKKSIEVDCRTLIEIMQTSNVDLERNPSFIKLDCEGSEYEILESIDNEYLSKIKVISMEYHLKKGEKLMKRLVKRLKYLTFNIEIRPDKFHPNLGCIYAFQE